MSIRSSRVVPLLVVVASVACGGSGEVVSMPDLGSDRGTASVADPFGDTFGLVGTPQWDLGALTITREESGIVVLLDFANEVALPVPGDASALVGIVEFDLDQDPSTGARGIVDQLRTDGGSTGMGVDGALNLSVIASDSTLVVYDRNGQPVGRAKVQIGGRRLTIRVPSALIGNDDGYLDAAVIVGNGRSPTDLAPQSGHLSLSRPPSTS